MSLKETLDLSLREILQGLKDSGEDKVVSALVKSKYFLDKTGETPKEVEDNVDLEVEGEEVIAELEKIEIVDEEPESKEEEVSEEDDEEKSLEEDVDVENIMSNLF